MLICCATGLIFSAAVFASSAASAQTGPSTLQPAHPSTLPSMPPTSLTPATPASVGTTNAQSTPAYTNAPATQIAPQAKVTYTGGQLEIHADNSSLNQILRSISHLTGLKITGGVPEQRVFGAYGPAPVAAVLATLLDGTGTNILLLEGSATTPPVLVLTPRSGGAAPPSPDSPIYSAYDNASHATAPGQQPPPSAPSQTMSTSTSGVSNPQPSASNSPQAPTGGTAGSALTPQMVAQKLLEMQRGSQPATNGAAPH
jgi:hypothetical protein